MRLKVTLILLMNCNTVFFNLDSDVIWQDLLLRVKAPSTFAWGACSLVPNLILFFLGLFFLGPFFLQAFQDLRVKAPLFFVDHTRAFGGVCEADLQKIFLRQISKLSCRSK